MYKPLAGDAAAVGRHYDRFVEAERVRLEDFCPIEYAITLRYLGRFIPESCTLPRWESEPALLPSFLAAAIAGSN
ncbi:MAG TPA: hypothetical protein VGG72_09000 [Bryobacteraceae bacterium]|jgi:hypothetical protein